MSERLETPIEIATKWYGFDEIHHSIQASLGGDDSKYNHMPTDVTSRLFSDWLTMQYRLAMAKGIQLGRGTNPRGE